MVASVVEERRGTRAGVSTRSSVGSITTLSNLLRMLYSRAGTYPSRQPLLYAESFSPNTPLTIRERAIAAWPTAWGGQNQRDILVSLGYDVDLPWRALPKKDREWILFTDDQPAR